MKVTHSQRLSFLLRFWLPIILITLVLVFPLSPSAYGAPASPTHFRFGHIAWERSGPNTADFTFTASFRRCGFTGSAADGCPATGDIITETIGNTLFCFGDGNCTGTLRFRVFAINAPDDWILARALEPGSDTKETITHIYPNPGPFTAFSATCCRISPPTHINNPDGNYRLEAIVDFGKTTGNPRSLLPPIVDCPQNATCQLPVPAVDPDGQPLRFRLSTSNEAGPGFIQPGPPHAPNAATVGAATGFYTWNTTGATLNPDGETLYSTQVTIEDLDAQGNPVSKSVVDFFIRLVEAPPPPTDRIQIPIRWCAIEGSPSIVDPGRVGETSPDGVLLRRHMRANTNFFSPQANMSFQSGTSTTAAMTNFPAIPDPDLSVGDPGDLRILDQNGNYDNTEFQQVINSCRLAWERSAPEVTGVIAVHINRFVDMEGDLIGAVYLP